MLKVDKIVHLNLDSVPIDAFWNCSENDEIKMHRIHAFPAKFPAFITNKALEFARSMELNPRYIADVFCGCGTVALEAKRSNLNFWGCDINPVATMIAKAKSRGYQTWRLNEYFEKIVKSYKESTIRSDWKIANERLKYWYERKQYDDLFRLKMSIEMTVPSDSPYRIFFLCAFSNVLKKSSRWLTKSIKPQIDPAKKTVKVLSAFKEQYKLMKLANEENNTDCTAMSEIVTGNFLDDSLDLPKVDMIITSPPYVTSYEYADIHQLSSLWLGYTNDYRDLRTGSIGSLYHFYNFNKELKRLNSTGSKIVFGLLESDKEKARSVAKYYLDMQKVAEKCYGMLNNGGIAFFVIGNTEYKGVRIDNAKHLIESLKNTGFNEILISKRKISKKILTPYRDNKGRFTTDSKSRKVYGEEFILIGRK